MPLDPNIILQGQQPQIANPLDIMGKALTMKHLAQQGQLQDQEIAANTAIKGAYNKNITIGPDGTPILNKTGLMSTLADQGYGKQALDAGQQAQAQELATKAAQMKNLQDTMEAAHANAMSMQDAPSYAAALANGRKIGLPGMDSLPPNYDPAFVRQLQTKTSSLKDQLAQSNSDRDYGLRSKEAKNKEKELQIEQYKNFGGDPSAATGPTGAPLAAAQPVAPQTMGQFAATPQVAGQASAAAPQTQAAASPRSPQSAMPAPAAQPAATPAQAPPQAQDPAELVRRLVPPAHQQKVFDQIEAAQNTSANAGKILAAFDAAAKEVRPMSGRTGTSGTAFVPGMASPNQKAMHALMGPTFKDVEGTVRQAAMDNMNNNTTPQFGDGDDTIAIKRAALEGYLKSKSAASTAKGFGIDLTKFPSTNYSLDAAKPQSVIQNGHTYTLNAKTGEYE